MPSQNQPPKSNEVPERKDRYDTEYIPRGRKRKVKKILVSAGDGWSTGKILGAVPDEDINLLVQIGDQSTMYYWYIGDMANKWVAVGMPHMWVYRAVAELVGKSTSSIRNYAYIARKFNRDIREHFSILRFEHFVFALKCDAPYDVLEYAVGVADERGGKPATVDELEGVFRGQRRLKIDDEKLVFGAKAFWPPYTIGVRRKLLQIDDPERKVTAEKMLLALCEYIDGPLTNRE